MRSQSLKILLLTLLALLSAGITHAQTVLIASNAVWKYLDNGTDQATAWQASGFNDATWTSGVGEFGYGDGFEVTTNFPGPDLNNKYVTTYYRKTFNVADPLAYGSLLYTLTYDDGVVAYLNGAEVLRVNMPTGPIVYSTFAVGAADYTPVTGSIATTGLVAGQNTLAVEVHQGSATSSDMSFSITLSGNASPTVSLTSPTNNNTFVGPLNITLSANAADSDGSISLVEFFSGAEKIGEDSASPFSVVWSNVPENVYSLTALATDNTGGQRRSAPISITVSDPNPPTIRGVLASTNQVFVTFSKKVTAPTANTSGNYTINNAVAVNGATLGTDPTVVVLDTSHLTLGVNYTLTVNNVADSDGHAIAANSQAPFGVVDFIPQTIGTPGSAGSFVPTSNGYTVSGAGEIGGGTNDAFYFVQRTQVGDFDVKVRVESLGLTTAWAKAGLVARENLTPSSRFAATLATPEGGTINFVSRRTENTGATSAGAFPVNYPYTWLRLKREGNVITGFGSWDGDNWGRIGSATFDSLASSLYFGLAVSSHNATSTTGQFRDFAPVVGGTIDTVQLPREPLGPSNRRGPLVISEIMYNPRSVPGQADRSLEFIELFNSQAWDESLTGYRISGDVDYTFAPGTIIKAGGFLVIARDPGFVQSYYGISGVLGPWAGTNGLPNDAGRLRIRGGADEVLWQVDYSDHEPWPVSPDGTGHSLCLTKPSYGEQDPRAWGASDTIDGSPGRNDGTGPEPLRAVVINEFLAHTDLPSEDYIELYNRSTQQVDISGAWLSDEAGTNKFRIPNGTVLAPRGFRAFTLTPPNFLLNSEGESIFFVNSNQTRVIEALTFEAQANGVPRGRYPDGGSQFYELSSQTPGASNAPVKLAPVVINEIMYSPITGNENDEYVELYNRGNTPLNLSGWQFTAGISFIIPAGTIVPTNGYLVVAKNATNLIGKYSQLNAGNTVGGFDGTLANGGERIALSMPEDSISTNIFGNPITNIVYVLVDEITYGDGGRWGFWSDGGGSSLELKDPNSDNRQPANWADSDESSKSTWGTVQGTGPFGETLGGPINDNLQIFSLGLGEFLIDDVEVVNFGGGNSISNPGFETGLTGWTLQGSHDMSTVVSPGFSGNSALRVRAASRGDNGANRIRSPVFSPAIVGTVAAPITVRAKVRWLRGSSEFMLRIHGGSFEVAGQMPLPPNLGSPGLRNSVATNNAGPAMWDLSHRPVLPASGEPVTVTIRAQDPDDIASLSLKYRVGTGSSTTVALTDNGTAGDAVAGDGLYSGIIPAQNSNAVVSFYFEAVDGKGAVNTFPQRLFPEGGLPRVFPTDAVSRELVVRWGEVMPAGRFGSYRLWLTPENTARWTQRLPVLNNAVFDATFVYNNYRVIYNMSPQFAGSPWHRGQMTTGPDGTQRVDYDIEYPSDDRFMGTTDAVWNNPGNPDAATTSDTSAQSEQTSYLMFKGLNIHYNYRRYVHVFVNGSQRNITGNLAGTFIMEDSQQAANDTIEEWSPGETDGDLYKIEDWFEFPDNGQDFTANNDADLTRRNVAGTNVLNLAPYRFMWRRRSVSAGVSANDYTTLKQVIDIVSPNSNPGSQTIENLAGFSAVVDWEQWMRIFAVQHVIGNWDSYGYERGKNDYMYQPKGGQFDQWTWDIDFTMGVGGHNPGLIEGTSTSDPRVSAMIRTPAIGRAYWRGIQDLLDGPFSNSYMDPILDAKAAALRDNGITYAPGTVTTIKSFISGNRTVYQAALNLNGRSAPLALNGPSSITNNNNLVVITGVAPVKIKDFYVNGVRVPVTWTSINTWTARLTAQPGQNVFNIQGYDSQDRPIANAETTLTVTYTGAGTNPEGTVVISEIMYDPIVPGAAYIELYNRSTNFAFDLSGWELNGVDFTFPAGTILGSGERVVIAQDAGAVAAAYRGPIPIVGTFAGTLDKGGETLTLIKPGATPAQNIIVDRVRYDDDAPWAVARGNNRSLQVLDPAQDNSRVANWSDGSGWRFFSYTGVIGGAKLFLFLNGPGTIWVDNISVVTGAVAEVGANLAVNGNFESGFDGWAANGSHAASTNDTVVKYAGNGSLRIVSTGPGSGAAAVTRTFTGITASGTYTMSFYYLPSTNDLILTARFGSAYRPEIDVSGQTISPGAPTLSARLLPPFPSLWLNEVQPINTTTITDNASDRDPWIELYNSGPGAVSLDGLYLANNYTSNLTQWAFPAGSSINPGEYKVVWADGETGEGTATQFHTSFRLNNTTGSVALVRLVDALPQIIDYLNYENVPADQSYGAVPDGQPFNRQILFTATPGTTNKAQQVALYINEWMAGNTTTIADPADNDLDDWFEIYNPGTNDVDLSGFYLTDDLGNKTKYLIPGGGRYVVPKGGFLLVWADEETNQNNSNRLDLHVNFKLGSGGESIGLFAPNGDTVAQVTFGAQTNDISEGFIPDGVGSRQFMTAPTPRASNRSGGGNGTPTINPINNQTLSVGQNFQLTITASDPDQPAQSLSFSLDAGAPAGTAITTGGSFTWTPAPNQAGTTNQITVRVTDNGSPVRSSTRTFQVIVSGGPQVGIIKTGNDIGLSFATIVGRTYRVEYKNDLNNPLAPWTPVSPAFVAASASITVHDDVTGQAQRFYRIVQVD